MCPTRADGMSWAIPSTIPRPARRIGTSASFFPATRTPCIGSRGVSTSTGSSGRSFVTSYAISIAISLTSCLKSRVVVCLSRRIVSLCRIRGWSSTVRLSVVGMDRAAVTAEDGGFVLAAVPEGMQRVRASRIGFAAGEQTVAVTAGQIATLNFAIQPIAVTLSDVVVVGYGTQRRADLTGAVASVSAAELRPTAVASLEQGLEGRVAGVHVIQGDAAPGGGIRVQIRGVNSMSAGSAQPLYVIDGVPWVNSGVSKRQLGAVSEENLSSLTETNPLSAIAPEDIESIDVLKDASATAIYGSRGANGVVLITTKRGDRARGGRYTLTYSQGYSSVVREIPVLNAYDFATYVNTAYIHAYGPTTQYPYGGRPGSVTPDSIRTVLGAGANWQDAT